MKGRCERNTVMNKPKQQIYCRKSIDELTFADRWMFDMVMRDETVCKSFLEALLETKIRRIQYIDSGKTGRFITCGMF